MIVKITVNVFKLANFLKSIPGSIEYIAIILNAISVLVLTFRPCIYLMQNQCALSKLICQIQSCYTRFFNHIGL